MSRSSEFRQDFVKLPRAFYPVTFQNLLSHLHSQNIDKIETFSHIICLKKGEADEQIYNLRETPTSLGLSRQKFAESNLRGKLGSWNLHLWFCTAPLSYPNFWKNYVNHVVNADCDSQDLNKLRDKTLLILPLSLLLAGWQRLEAFRRG